jgi:FAD dependent oxidoreductase
VPNQPERYDVIVVGGGSAEATKRALDEICLENNVDVPLHAFVGSAERDRNRIASVTYLDHGGAHLLYGKAFIDATGDCDLASFAGASTRYGNHGAVNLGTLGTRFSGISPDTEVSADAISRAVQAARTRGVGPITKERSVVARTAVRSIRLPSKNSTRV